MRYYTKGVCTRYIDIETDGEIITGVDFHGGCSGNTQGIAKLVKGMKIDDVINRMRGTRCGFKSTSCPDQLAQALEKIKNDGNN